MKKLTNFVLALFSIVVAGAMTLGFVGCTSESPLDSSGKLSSPGEVRILQMESGPLTFGADGPEPITVSGLITPKKGGTLVLRQGVYAKDDRKKKDKKHSPRQGIALKLRARPGSVDRAMTVQLTLQNPDIDMEFGPHGAVFNRDLLLNVKAIGLDLTDVNTETLGIYYVNSETGEWEKAEHARLRVKAAIGFIKILKVRIPHFSRYALAWSN